jgi:hypothetical protein
MTTTSEPIPGEFECRIVDIDGGQFSALCVGPDGVEVYADFDVTSLPADEPLQVGDVFWAPSMTLFAPPPLTVAQVAEIRAEADRRWAVLKDLID